MSDYLNEYTAVAQKQKDAMANYAKSAVIGGLTQVGLATQATQRISPFAAVEDARTNVLTVEKRLVDLAIRLVGPWPETDGNGISPAPSGVFDALGEAAGSISVSTNRMHQALNAIERALP